MIKRCIYSFTDVPPTGVDPRELFGGKGLSLMRMTRAGLPVPHGFVITTETCRHYFAHDKTWPEHFDAELQAHLQRLEQEAQSIFGDTLFVAVRSGAPISMPGMMDTFLNCGFHPGRSSQSTPELLASFADNIRRYTPSGGQVSPTQLPESPLPILKKCISAVFESSRSLRAAMYRQRQMLSAQADTAVVIQAMVHSEQSGVIFTQDPNDSGRGELVIESCHGYGDKIVSGKTTPHAWRVSRNDLSKIRLLSAPTTATLTTADVQRLCALALKAESQFGVPLDIEWGLSKGQFALFQCRPIKELEDAKSVAAVRQREIGRLQNLAGRKRKLWVAHNLAETLPFPTPLTWDILQQYAGPNGGLGMMYRDLGFSPSPDLTDNRTLELIGGRIYSDVERATQCFVDGLPFGCDLSSIQDTGHAPENLPLKFDPDRITDATLFRLPLVLLRLLACHRRSHKARIALRSHFEHSVVPPYLDYVRSKRGQDLAVLTSAALIGELNDRCARVLVQFAKEALKPGHFAMEAYKKLLRLMVGIMGPKEGLAFARRFARVDDQFTIRRTDLLRQIATGGARMDQFLETYGHRALCDMELAEPRWRETQGYLTELVHDLHDKGERGRSDPLPRGSDVSAMDVAQLLAKYGATSFREEIVSSIEDLRELIPLRERAKDHFLRGYECIRLVILELGRRFDLGSDIFFLTRQELHPGPDLLNLRTTIATRKSSWRTMQLLHPGPVIDSANMDQAFSPPTQHGGDWRGEAVSAGQATAPAFVVTPTSGACLCGEDRVLVCSDVSALWPPMLLNARGLILERGGILSHSAVVARTLGIPAVIFPKATAMIANGEMVRIDGTTGLISKLT